GPPFSNTDALAPWRTSATTAAPQGRGPFLPRVQGKRAPLFPRYQGASGGRTSAHAVRAARNGSHTLFAAPPARWQTFPDRGGVTRCIVLQHRQRRRVQDQRD